MQGCILWAKEQGEEVLTRESGELNRRMRGLLCGGSFAKTGKTRQKSSHRACSQARQSQIVHTRDALASNSSGGLDRSRREHVEPTRGRKTQVEFPRDDVQLPKGESFPFFATRPRFSVRLSPPIVQSQSHAAALSLYGAPQLPPPIQDVRAIDYPAR